MTDTFVITRDKIVEITNNLIITPHARKRIAERLGNFTDQQIKEMLLKAHLSWRDKDGSIKITNNKGFCFVIEINDNAYVMTTLLQPSANGVTTEQKFLMSFFNKGNKQWLKNKKNKKKRK